MPQNPLANADTMNAPWGLESRFKLVMAACKFFSLSELADNYAGIGKQLPTVRNPKPLTVGGLTEVSKPTLPKPYCLWGVVRRFDWKSISVARH